VRGARLAAGLLLVVAASPAAHAFTPTAQERRAAAYADLIALPFQFHFEDVQSAPDFSPFSAVADDIAPGDGIATQDSQIEPDSLHATGSVASSAEAGAPNSLIEVDAESIFDVTFDVATHGPFELSGQLDLTAVGCDGATIASIALWGPGGVIAQVNESLGEYGAPFTCGEGCQESVPISASGVMAPGTYRLRASVTANTREIETPSDMCPGVDVTGAYAVDLVRTPPQVPALPAAWGGVLAAALALAARRR
jgi:hypothetical protein